MIAATNAAATPATNGSVAPEASQEAPVSKPKHSEPEQLPTGIYQSMLDGLNNFKEG
jgi:hypothetical protein